MTPEQQEQQDKVDGAIFDLIQNLTSEDTPWDIEKIGAIRDKLIEVYPEVIYP